jgi:citrate lyase subunit beta/citryl-CoA lyase
VTHPRDVLLGAFAAPPLPVCDHYCGVESRMVKSLALQAELAQEYGACVFDVSLDCEDGAPVGGENDHAFMVAALAVKALTAINREENSIPPRVAVRVHPVDHPAFAQDVDIIVSAAGAHLCHLMLPKVESVADVELALAQVDAVAQRAGRIDPLPIHCLIESPLAVQCVPAIAAHPRVQSLSFGLMDFVSAHGGAIPASAMRFAVPATSESLDQFSHPLVLRAKLEISAACHAAGKVPSHCVVTEFKNLAAVESAARQASRAFGFTRMWSIHPDQIRPILAAFAPSDDEVSHACDIIYAAQVADWAPISVQGQLHDRASYRYFWQVLERAHQTARLHRGHPGQAFFAA